jgi:short-subunit dehydrogenase involved in D-alanine esterification of teichoic acids
MKVLITGGTNGMGKGVAKALAGLDNQAHEIIILCRSKELGEAVIKEIVNTTSNKKISTVLCDLTKLSDVKRAIIEIQNKHEFLDGIFINAGLGYAAKRVETEDGLDSHFQVNYLSQFMLTLNLLNLLKNSEKGGRIIFNVTKGGKIFWDDIQMKKKWSFEDGIHQAMVAKRMFLAKLYHQHREIKDSKLSFIGFEISKTVWSNQINIIPDYMKTMATLMKLFGTFISIEKCGEIMTPLFTENKEESLKKSGKFITWKKNEFIDIKEDLAVLNQELQDRLWKISLELCADEKTNQIAENPQNQ